MGAEEENHRFKFIAAVLIFQLVLIIIFATCTDYSDSALSEASGDDATGVQSEIDHLYPFYQDVHVMIFVGFGFLMTFLKKYTFGAVGFNFVIAAITIQWSMFVNAYAHNIEANHPGSTINIGIENLITSDFAAGAVLITFGAVLGKISPLQMVFVIFFEIIFYAINEVIGATVLGAVDMGGSIFVHTFGAYFGLALSFMISTPTDNEKAVSRNGSTYQSDTFAMIGTLFLWMFWPSFNGALALESQQHRVVINTVLALCGSCICAFAFDSLLRPHRKFDMVSIQNATLAGGVAVGSSSDLVIEPWGAVLTGCVAGAVSVYGYVYLTPWLSEKCRLDDTCGVHNLHGIPGIMGAVGGAISAASAGSSAYGQNIGKVFPRRAPANLTEEEIAAGLEPGDGLSASQQASIQVAALFITLGFAIVGGSFTGLIVKHPWFTPNPQKAAPWSELGKSSPPEYWYRDDLYWEIPPEGYSAVGNEDDDEEANEKQVELVVSQQKTETDA